MERPHDIESPGLRAAREGDVDGAPWHHHRRTEARYTEWATTGAQGDAQETPKGETLKRLLRRLLGHRVSRALVAPFLHKCCTSAQAASSPQPFHHSFFTKIKPAEIWLRRPLDSLKDNLTRKQCALMRKRCTCCNSVGTRGRRPICPSPSRLLAQKRLLVCPRHRRRRRMLCQGGRKRLVRGAVYAGFAHLRASSVLGLPDWYKRSLGLSNGRESKGMARG